MRDSPSGRPDGSRILIAGTGALGSVFGGFLRKAGYDVTLFGRDQHLTAIERAGLHISGIWGDHCVADFSCARSVNELRGPYDVILLPVKSYDTRAMAELVVAHLASDGVIISLQNGLGNVETVQAIAGADRTLGARVIFGAITPEPGHVRVTVIADPNALGGLQSHPSERRNELAKKWAGILNSVGVPTLYTDNLEAKLWAKVLYNAALNPLSALLGVHYGALPQRDDSLAIMNLVIREAFAVATAEAVVLPWKTADAYCEEFYGRLVPATFDHRSSMLQDLERGRRTEIEAINGAVWQRGEKRGIPTPINEMLTRLIRLRER